MRIVIALAVVLASICSGGHEHKNKVKVITAQDIAEKVDGKDAKATTLEVTIEPGKESAPHRHPGPVFGYVLEGEYDWATNDQPVKKLKPGDTFYEPTGALHRVSHNPGKVVTRLLVVMLHPRDAKELVIPEKRVSSNKGKSSR
jgi:quercetin dioxygenase-like cupin family protein